MCYCTLDQPGAGGKKPQNMLLLYVPLAQLYAYLNMFTEPNLSR